MQYLLTDEHVQAYNKIRKVLKDLHPKFIACLDRNVVNVCGNRLKVMQDNNLLLNTEHEMNVFFDYCMYMFRRDELNIIQQGFNSFAKHYAGEDLKIFTAAKDGSFAYLEIIEPINDAGLVVYNAYLEKKYLMLDNGLNKVAKINGNYTIVTHIMHFDDFIITTGASTPVNINTSSGKKVHDRFAAFMDINKKMKINIKEELQYITDMYKLILHEDITGTVESPPPPFGAEALKKRVIQSDLVH